MFTRILHSFRFKAELTRLDFLVGLIIALSIAGILGGSSVVPTGDGTTRGVLIRQSTLFVVFSILFVPILVGRLKSVGWPTLLSILVLPPIIVRCMFLFHISTSGAHTSKQAAWYASLGNIVTLVLIGFTLSLLLWPAKVTRDT